MNELLVFLSFANSGQVAKTYDNSKNHSSIEVLWQDVYSQSSGQVAILCDILKIHCIVCAILLIKPQLTQDMTIITSTCVNTVYDLTYTTPLHIIVLNRTFYALNKIPNKGASQIGGVRAFLGTTQNDKLLLCGAHPRCVRGHRTYANGIRHHHVSPLPSAAQHRC